MLSENHLFLWQPLLAQPHPRKCLEEREAVAKAKAVPEAAAAPEVPAVVPSGQSN